MKLEVSLRKSMEATLRHAMKANRELTELLPGLDGTTGDTFKTNMAQARERAETLLRKIHEFSAYHNSLNTD